MTGRPTAPSSRGPAEEVERVEARERCRELLAREGLAVRATRGRGRGRDGRSADLIGTKGDRVVRVLVVLGREIDAPGTAKSVRRASREGETRVYVPRVFRWRMISNLERWRVPGVAVVSF